MLYFTASDARCAQMTAIYEYIRDAARKGQSQQYFDPSNFTQTIKNRLKNDGFMLEELNSQSLKVSW